MIERVAKLLAERGPMSTRKIGEIMGIPAERVGDCLKHPRSRGRYGISIDGKVRDGDRGSPSNLLSVDARILERYLAVRGPYTQNVRVPRSKLKAVPLAAPKAAPKAAPVKEPKVEYNRPVPEYNGPHKTVWQPTSPYKKEPT
jgi:hypothetical protein